MLKGIHLTLLIGPVVPVPAPRAVLDALQSIEITVTDTGPGVFQMRFSISKGSPLETVFLLTAGATPVNLLRVVVMVTVGGTASVLIDGIVTQQQILPGAAAAHSTLALTGEATGSAGVSQPSVPAASKTRPIVNAVSCCRRPSPLTRTSRRST